MLGRARILAPFVLLAQVVGLALSESAGIPLTKAVIYANVVIDVVVATLGLLLWLRRVPLRDANLVAAILWSGPVLSTLFSLAATQSSHLFALILLEIATGVVMLSSSWLIVLFVIFDAAWLVIGISVDLKDFAFESTDVLVAQCFVILLHRMKLATVVQSEELRLAVVRQLEELRASEAARAELAEQLVHSQRLDAIGTLAAGLAHDMNNVLGAIMGLADELAHAARDTSQHTDLEQIVREAERGAELTRGLLAFSRRGQYRRQIVSVGEIIDDVAGLLGRTLPKAIELDKDVFDSTACIEGDPTQFSQAIMNLGLNAADAMNGKGVLRIVSETVDLEGAEATALQLAAGRYVRIEVIDTGTGMDEHTRSRLFEPFFTTKPLGKGTGLGLALVWGVVTKSRGTVAVASKLGHGSTFSIYLPICDGEPRPRISSSNLNPQTSTRGTVLIVDDEPSVREATARMLTRLGLKVIAAAGGEEGLRLFQTHSNEICLVLLDMAMPGMSGADVFAALRAHSKVRVIIVTGYALEDQVQDLAERGARVLEKPFRLDALEREIDAALGRLRN
jgi:two-component system cell cycle sensor histidine kinase/response regulator CckA